MVDFTPWDKMLQTYVQHGAVDYKRWKKESAQALSQWLDKVKATDVDKMERESMIAFLVNLYNALVIEQILQKYPIDSIRPTFLGIPNWISFLLFFKKSIYRLNEQPVSLDNVEHGILRDRYTEPRIHFAVVCAAQGCPLLRGSAYLPETLDVQLTEDADRFINNPEKVRYDAASQTLYCSKILKWYESDFLTQERSIRGYIQRYIREQQIPSDAKIEYLPYDWHLNQRMSS